MELELSTFLIVCPLVFLGSVVDAIAGGGGLITLPAYLMAGVPPHLALGTSKLSSTMGMATSAWRLYRSGFTNLRLSVLPVAAAFVGSFVGARLALLVPEAVFELLLVGMLPFAALFVMSKKTLSANPEAISPTRQMALLALCAFLCGTYDGFYGPGAGTLMLISFSAVAHLAVREAAGQMKMVNFSSGLAAFVSYAVAGEVNWALGLAAGLFGIAGHYIGAGLVIKNGVRVVRPLIVLVIAALFAKTAWDYFAG